MLQRRSPGSPAPLLVRLFGAILAARLWIVLIFAVLTAAGIYGALHVPADSAIERLIVADDPLAQATRDYERLFPEGEHALLMLEARDPWSAPALEAANRLESELNAIPHVAASSVLTLYRHGRELGAVDAERARKIRAFAEGTALFRQAGIVGDGYLGIALDFRVDSPAERDQALAAIDSLVAAVERSGTPFPRVRRVGGIWLDAWLERQTGTATTKFMPLFGVFLLTLVYFVFSSWRTLAAMVLTLGAVVAVAVGLGYPCGWTNTVVSALVPLTVLVTTTATLVYIHARYMQPDEGAPPGQHAQLGERARLEQHARALANKFVPCTASMFATAVGFAALVVSQIQPIRDMGLWTAAGLCVAWLACFTLFPALQALLRTPRHTAEAPVGRRFAGFVDFLVPVTRRHRWLLVGCAVALMVCGAVSLFGWPGLLPPLTLETDALTYVEPKERVAQDTRRYEQSHGLDVINLWLQVPPGHALDPQFLRVLDGLTATLEGHAGIDAVDGPTSILRWARYIESGSDQLPTEAAAWPQLSADLDQLLLTEPGARDFVDVAGLANVHLSIRGRGEVFGRAGSMEKFVMGVWAQAQARDPALRAVHGQLAGKGVLAGEITLHLLPTLIESFAVTAGVIFLAFLIVFRSPSARLMTIIPSLFAILAVFIVMRMAAIPLNIATILIGSTVLGATENDQVHFFYHFQEGTAKGGTETALRHALLVAGRPILFATLINASGFLALALSDLPPMRQFGIVASLGFILSVVADFSALPAALWILKRR